MGYIKDLGTWFDSKWPDKVVVTEEEYNSWKTTSRRLHERIDDVCEHIKNDTTSAKADGSIEDIKTLAKEIELLKLEIKQLKTTDSKTTSPLLQNWNR